MSKNFRILYTSILFSPFFIYSQNYDLTLIGDTKFCGSILRFPITVIDMLKDNLKINIIRPNQKDSIFLDIDISTEVKNIILNKDKTPGTVSLLLMTPSSEKTNDYLHAINSKINLAYSMTESTEVPPQWVEIFNNNFDAVIVPDEFLVEVYKDSGIIIPIFVLAFPIYIDDFLSFEPKKTKNSPFVFGTSSSLIDRKNHASVINAFANIYRNNPDFKLKIHGRFGDVNKLKNLVKSLNANNIEVFLKQFTQKEYINFLSSLDCYVLASKSEGFSISPREALALQIPCILSNNSGHRTIIKTELVRSVETNIKEPYHYGNLFNKYIGHCFNCEIKDLEEAFSDVFNNYSKYLDKANQAREWVKQYSYKTLSKKFLNLAKPKQIILSDKNIIEDDYIMTSSKYLYDKYKKYLG